jgi:SAM-dependent methyltransferase
MCETVRVNPACYWDSIAARYLELFRDELDSKPFDRDLLARFAAALPPGGRVCDAGCGPCGHIGRFLSDCGLAVHGIDVSPECVRLARLEQPAIPFQVMDMNRMDFPGASFDGVAAFYALHYQPRAAMAETFLSFRRVLRPGGRLLLAAKDGDEEGFIADPLGGPGEVFWSAAPLTVLAACLEQGGFRVHESIRRDPLPGEIAVPRLYILGERL